MDPFLAWTSSIGERNNVKVLAFFAHPDDETMLAGGTLALLAQDGVRVDYLCATRGEGGERGEPHLCMPGELGEIRQKETECAVRVLGGNGVTFLDYVDPIVGQGDELYPYTDDLVTLIDQVHTYIKRLQPDAILTHGSNGEYGHPAHILTHKVARMAIQAVSRSTPNLYTVSANYPGHPKPRIANQDDPAHIVVDIKPVLDIKIKAALCHRTQNALFVRRASLAAGRQLSVADVILTAEGMRRVLPKLESVDRDPLFKLLAPYWMDSDADGI